MATAYTSAEALSSIAARALFYPSLLYNVTRSSLQENWHWFDEITEHVLLGALPFQSMLTQEFVEHGVRAVVTLNEDFEVFISTEQYKDAGIDHLHLPTVDFLFAPSVENLHRGVDFIAEHADRGELTYVHCKAGRGRSTTVVLCYLIKHKGMAPTEALAMVRAKRPQIHLAQGQWAAIEKFAASCGSCVTKGSTEPQAVENAQPLAADTAQEPLSTRPGQEASSADPSVLIGAAATSLLEARRSALQGAYAAPAAPLPVAHKEHAGHSAAGGDAVVPLWQADDSGLGMEASSCASWPACSQTCSAAAVTVGQGAAAPPEQFFTQPSTLSAVGGAAAAAWGDSAKLHPAAAHLHRSQTPAEVPLPVQLLQSASQPDEAAGAANAAALAPAMITDPPFACRDQQREQHVIAARQPQTANDGGGAPARRGIGAAAPAEMSASWPHCQRQTWDGDAEDMGSSWESDVHAGPLSQSLAVPRLNAVRTPQGMFVFAGWPGAFDGLQVRDPSEAEEAPAGHGSAPSEARQELSGWPALQPDSQLSGPLSPPIATTHQRASSDAWSILSPPHRAAADTSDRWAPAQIPDEDPGSALEPGASHRPGPVGSAATVDDIGDCLQLADRRDSNVSLVFVSAPSCELPDDAVLIPGLQDGGNFDVPARRDACPVDERSVIAGGRTAKTKASSCGGVVLRGPAEGDGAGDDEGLCASWPALRADAPWGPGLRQMVSSAHEAADAEADGAAADAAVASTREWLRQLACDGPASATAPCARDCAMPSAQTACSADMARTDAAAGCSGPLTPEMLSGWPGTGEHSVSDSGLRHLTSGTVVAASPLHAFRRRSEGAEVALLQPTEMSGSLGCAWPAQSDSSPAAGTLLPLLTAECAGERGAALHTTETTAPPVAMYGDTAIRSAADVESTGLSSANGTVADRPAARGRWQAFLPHSWLA